MNYYKRQSIKLHREFAERDADMLLSYGVIDADEHAKRIANISDQTGETCDVCKEDNDVDLLWWRLRMDGKVVARSRRYWWYYSISWLHDRWDAWRGNCREGQP